MQKKPVISNHWDLFVKLIRLSNKIGASLPGCTNYIRDKKLYEEYEAIFFKQVMSKPHYNTHGTFYEGLKYKGKIYYFKVRITMDDWKCYIDFTTDPNGWNNDL